MKNTAINSTVLNAPKMVGMEAGSLFDVCNHFNSAMIEMIAMCDLVSAKNVYIIRKKT